MLADDEPDALRLAVQCIDYRYRIEAWEVENGRKWDAMKDGLIPSNG